MIHFAISLLLSSLVVSVIILGLLLLGKLKVFSPRTCYIAWIVVLVGLLVPIRPVVGEGLIGVPVTPGVLVVEQSYYQPFLMQPANIANTDLITQPVAGQSVLQYYTGASLAASVSIYVYIALLVWITIAVCIFGYHVLKYTKFCKLVKRWSYPITNVSTIDIFENIKAKNKVARNIGLRKCSFISTTMLIGFLRPVILLPERDFDNEELCLIFTHELIHYKRGDLFVKLANVVALSLYWFNPVVYFMSFALGADCEASCDQAVLAQTQGEQDKQFYAELIIDMIGTPKSLTLLSTCFYTNSRGIKTRMNAIMEAKHTALRKPAIVGFAMIVFLIGLSGSVFAVDMQPPSVVVVYNEMQESQQIGLAQLKETALLIAGGGTLYRIEAGLLHGSQDSVVLGIAVINESRIYHVLIDYQTGIPVGLHISSPQENYGISLERAIQIAYSDLRRRGIIASFVSSSGIDWEYSQWVWELDFESQNGMIEYYIHINTGNIVRFSYPN